MLQKATKSIYRQSACHQKYRRSHNKTDVRHIWKVYSWTNRWALWSENHWLGKSFMEILVFGHERVLNLQRTKVYVFSDAVLCLGKMHENTQSNYAWEDRLTWFKRSTGIQRLGQNWRRANGIRVEYFQGFNTLQLSQQVKSLLLRFNERPQIFTGRIIFMSIFNGISCGSRDNETACESSALLVSLNANRLSAGQWSFFWLGSEKKWFFTHECRPQGERDNMVERMMLEFADNFPCFKSIVQRSTQKQRPWKIVDTLCSRPGNDWDYFSQN